MGILRKYQEGTKLEGPEYYYPGRSGYFYRKDIDGNWYIRKDNDNSKFIPIKDPDGFGAEVLNERAKVRSLELRKDDGLLYKGNELNDYEKQYLEELKFLENGVKAGYNNGIWKPHKSVEGGTDTIAYGHKLQRGEDFSKGLSEEEANKLLLEDYKKHKLRAQEEIDKEYGVGTFAKLRPKQQILLTDYAYNVGLSKFPSFVKGVVNNDTQTMLKEYTRYSGKSPMTQRNEWALKYIK